MGFERWGRVRGKVRESGGSEVGVGTERGRGWARSEPGRREARRDLGRGWMRAGAVGLTPVGSGSWTGGQRRPGLAY